MQAFFFFLSVCVFMLLFFSLLGIELGVCAFLIQAALPDAHLSRLCSGDTIKHPLEGQ